MLQHLTDISYPPTANNSCPWCDLLCRQLWQSSKDNEKNVWSLLINYVVGILMDKYSIQYNPVFMKAFKISQGCSIESTHLNQGLLLMNLSLYL